jgi:hypothetical protein
LKFTESLVFWVFAWLGTALSGSVFGAMIMVFELIRKQMLLGIFGVFIAILIGFVFAAIFAIPFVFTIAVATWAFWLTKFRMIAASLAGGVTGVIAAGAVFGGPHPFWLSAQPQVVLAGIVGAIGCPLFIYLFGRRTFFGDHKPSSPKMPWQFTLRDLFIHFTALAVLMSLWTWFFTSVQNARNSRQPFLQQQAPANENLPAAPSH